jgi:hypothetical protein
MDAIQEDTIYIGGKPLTIQTYDREEVYFELGLTESQAEKLYNQGVRIFKSETYLERIGHNFKRYFIIVKIEDLVKILPRR